jgi:hypothetical protein
MHDLTILVQGSRRHVEFCPVSVRVERSAKELADRELFDVAADAAIPFQIEPGSGGSTLHWLIESLAPGQEREYALRTAKAEPQTDRVRLDTGESSVSVTVGGELVTRYLFGPARPKPCLYPVVGPFGAGVTRAYPQEEQPEDSTDHVHHRSLWTGWGDVNGSDNWGEEDGAGRVAHRYFETVDSGPVFGRLVALDDWLSADGRSLMQDRVEYRFYRTPPSFRMFDREVTFYASEGPVRFGDTKEGGIVSVRVASALEVTRTGRIETALGAVNEGEAWGRRAPWCDYSGALPGGCVGIALFDHPSNLGYPTFWHVRDYGLMTANPFGLSAFVGAGADGSHQIPEGGRLTFRCRVYVHAGNAAQGRVATKYLDWVFPPSAVVRQ